MSPGTLLQVDGKRGAVFVVNGTSHTLVFTTPAEQASLKAVIDRGRAGGVDKMKWSKDVQAVLNPLFLASGRRVSDNDLTRLSTKLKVPFQKDKAKT